MINEQEQEAKARREGVQVYFAPHDRIKQAYRHWTPEDEQVVMTQPVKEAARLLGRSDHAIRSRKTKIQARGCRGAERTPHHPKTAA